MYSTSLHSGGWGRKREVNTITQYKGSLYKRWLPHLPDNPLAKWYEYEK